MPLEHDLGICFDSYWWCVRYARPRVVGGFGAVGPTAEGPTAVTNPCKPRQGQQPEHVYIGPHIALFALVDTNQEDGAQKQTRYE